MSVLAYEWRKLMFVQRGLACLVAAFAASMLWLCLSDGPQNSAMEEHGADYAWYLEKLEGPCTAEKADWLEGVAAAMTEAKGERAQAQEDYYGGAIAKERYDEVAARAQEATAHERGFDVAYQQYLYICENPDNRYFLETNGWAGLFAAQVLDFPLLLAILYLATTAFCTEYACSMDALLRTAPEGRASARCRIAIVLGAVAALSLAVSLAQFAFFSLKYGLPHGEYPMQCVAQFGAGAKSVSLFGAFAAVAALRCFGSLFLASVLFLISVAVRKGALTALVGAVITLVPLIGLPQQLLFRLPVPASFFLATGFLEGSRWVQEGSAEATAVFAEVSPGELGALLALAAALGAVSLWWTLRQSTNCWLSSAKTLRRGTAGRAGAARRLTAALLTGALLLFLCGCAAESGGDAVYNSSAQSLRGEGFVVAFDGEAQSFSLTDEGTGASANVEASPLFGVFSDEESVKGAYVQGRFVYYLTSSTRRHVDRVGSYNSTYTQVNIVCLDTRTQQRRVVFQQIANSERSLLGVDYAVGDTWAFLQDCHSFFLNSESIFFVVNDQVIEVARSGASVRALDISFSGNIAFDGTAIYFIDEDSRLCAYDTASGETASVGGAIARSFCLTGDGLCFVNRLDSDRVYACDREGGDQVLALDEPALSVGYDGEALTAVLKSGGREVVIDS